MKNSTTLTQTLIEKRSVTPDDAGCQTLLASLLQSHHFNVEDFSTKGVSNLWATHGTGKPMMIFAGHTDVVPAGDETLWQYPPFKATVENGQLYGRGACDMKAAVACMVTSACEFVKANPNHAGTVAILLTSDEEGEAKFGTKHVVAELKKRHVHAEFCLIGEPSASEQLGDTIKIGRRGSLHVDITIKGQSGHVAYPETVKNPAHLAASFLQDLNNTVWDNEQHQDFPPTSFQLTRLHSESSAGNTTPETLTLHGNFRFSPASDENSLKNKLKALLEKHALTYELKTTLAAKAFNSSPNGKLVQTASRIIENETGLTPTLSTSGGTSDGRFLIALCDELIELGMVNKTIHKIDEGISLESIPVLEKIYLMLLKTILY